MNDTYSITLKNCAFFARHGVMDEEERLGQRFFVDVTMHIENVAVLENDSLEDGVDYGNVYALIETIVTGQRFQLIEALALAIGKAICAAFTTVRHVEVTVRKPSAPVPGLLDYAEARVEYRG